MAGPWLLRVGKRGNSDSLGVGWLFCEFFRGYTILWIFLLFSSRSARHDSRESEATHRTGALSPVFNG